MKIRRKKKWRVGYSIWCSIKAWYTGNWEFWPHISPRFLPLSGASFAYKLCPCLYVCLRGQQPGENRETKYLLFSYLFKNHIRLYPETEIQRKWYGLKVQVMDPTLIKSQWSYAYYYGACCIIYAWSTT